MNCSEAQLLIGADPGLTDSTLEAHLASCPACQVYRDDMRALDARIRRVLLTNPPTAQASAAPSASRPSRIGITRGWLAIAASVLVVFASALGIWLARPTPVSAQHIAEHVRHEPQAWTTDRPVPRPALESVLARAGVHLGADIGAVTYATVCWFRVRWVPHLVVQTPEGPVTMLILPGTRTTGPNRIDEDGLTGLILPAEGGSIAVLSRSATNLETQARALVAAVTWRTPVTRRSSGT